MEATANSTIELKTRSAIQMLRDLLNNPAGIIDMNIFSLSMKLFFDYFFDSEAGNDFFTKKYFIKKKGNRT